MNYHLHFRGKNIGIFPLDDLRQRRLDGRLTGWELVWCEGMPNWQTLDVVLGIPSTAAMPPNFPTRQKLNPWLVAGIVAGSVLFICGLAAFGYVFLLGYRAAKTQISQTASAPWQGGAAGVEAASRPIQQTPKSLRQIDVCKMQKDFRVRQYLDAYQELGAHDQPWDADAKLLIRSWTDSNYDSENATNLPNPAKLGDKLAADSSCNDPIVLTAAAATSVELYEGTHRFERAVDAFAHSRYKAYPRFYATATMANNLIREHARIALLDKSALSLFKQCLSDGSVQPEDQPDMAETLLDGWGSGFFTRQAGEICSIADKAGPSFRWLALVLRGSDEINLAWKARGSGWGDSVTATGWQGFHDHLLKANAAFSEAWKLRPDWPQAPARMVTVIMAESDAGQARQWFDRATMAQLDYAPAWNNLRWALRPRWQGSLEAMRALGIAAVDSGRFDTDVPRQFFDCVTDIEADTNALPGQHIYGCPDIWPAMKRMYEGYIAEPSQARYSDGWRGTYAIVASIAQHYDIAREQLEKLHWQLPPGKLEGWGADLSLLPLEVAARTGPRARLIIQAEDARDQDKLAEALRLYQKLSATGMDELTQQFVQHRIASLLIEQRLQAGEWINFLPAATNDLNWITARGQYAVLPGGAVEIQSGPQGSMLFSRVRVGVEFEIKGQFEVVHSTTKDFQAGIMMGLPELCSYDWYAFLIKRNANEGDIAAYSKAWGLSSDTMRPKVTLDGRRNSFDFRLRNGKANASVNDIKVLFNAAEPGHARVCDNQFLVGLGAYNDMNETVIRYSNVQLRRLGTGDSSTER